MKHILSGWNNAGLTGIGPKKHFRKAERPARFIRDFGLPVVGKVRINKRRCFQTGLLAGPELVDVKHGGLLLARFIGHVAMVNWHCLQAHEGGVPPSK